MKGSGWLVNSASSHLVWMIDNGERELSTKAKRVKSYAAPTETFSTDLFEPAVSVCRSSLEAELETVEGLMKHGGHLTVPCHFSLAISLSPLLHLFQPNIPVP